MKRVTLGLFAAAVLLAGCGKETIREVLVTTPPTEAPAVEVSKYDQYLTYLYDSSAQAREWEESKLLELGSLVCDWFEGGNSVSGLIDTFSSYAEGSYDTEFYAVIMAGSVTLLCPEYRDLVNAQL
jgi:hypothetical protein